MEHHLLARSSQNESPPLQMSLSRSAASQRPQPQRATDNPVLHNSSHSPSPRINASRKTFTGIPSSRDFSRMPIRSMRPSALPAKLRVSQPGDTFEREADGIAEQVLHMSKRESSAAIEGPGWERQTGVAPRSVNASPLFHTMLSSAGAQPGVESYSGPASGMRTPAGVEQVLARPGKPLEPGVRNRMERIFERDFSPVRVHTDHAAAQSAREVNALAYTVGDSIVFGTGQFVPSTEQGRRLLAHELAHVVQQSDAILLQRTPDEPEESKGSSAMASPYPEESSVIAYAVGALKLGKFTEGMVLSATKDWTAAVLSRDAFSVGPFISDMGRFYFVYRFAKVDQATSTYTLTRGTYLPGPGDKNLQAGLAQVHGKTTLQVKTTGISPPSSGGTAGKDPKAETGTKATESKPGRGPSKEDVTDTPSGAADILPEFADKTVEQCREIVGDIYGGLNKEANSGILDHKLDAVNGMQTILDKTDPAVSSNLTFYLSLVTNAAAGALGAALPKIAFNAIIWGAAGAANGALAFFNNDNLIDAVEFCQEYMQSLRMNKDKAVKEVRSKIAGDLVQVRAAASAFRRLQNDPGQVSFIKLNQQQEVLDLWTNTMLAEKERRKGRKIGGPGDPGKIGSADYGSATEGRVLLAAGLLESNPPPRENPFRWTRSPDTATMPGVPDRARQKNLNRKISDMPVVRTMRVSTSLSTMWFTVAMSADGIETAQPFHSDPDLMQWVLASFLLDKPLGSESDQDQVKANWKLGITKCWDQVRHKTFAELGISSIIGEKGVYGE